MWARSYAQWLAQKSGDETLMRQRRGILEREAGYRLQMPTQWDPADFGPVARAMGDLFTSMGWL